MYQEEQIRHQKNIRLSDHSLGPDFFTGWQSKSMMPKMKQFPLIFANQVNDMVSKTLTSFGSELPYKVVYMGPRPASNMKAFKDLSLKNEVQQSFLYSKKKIKRYKFKHTNQAEKYFPIRPSEYRLFNGINPTVKNEDLQFSSKFQGGNLDLAINVGPNQYDLMMRVDSNTKGHTTWFFFKVFNIKKKKNVRFNIVNFTKNNQLYAEGMRPYVFRTSQKVWAQDGSNVEFKNRAIRYFNKNGDTSVSKCLSFNYQFNDTSQQVYFAYCIPYSYSYLLHFLQQMQAKHPQFLKVSYQAQSSGGLPLPILKISNFTKTSVKKTCLIIGRLHPGQTQGSWMVQGFIKYLCSSEGIYLRDKIQFRIVPMVNVDGVVLGNFRTGIGGRDLNRVFHKPNIYAEINILKNIAQDCKPQIFLDFHGHSGKRNVFIYGPQYKIQDKNYLPSRLLPKLISKKTDMFRYYSCIFRISDSKRYTGRAIMFAQYQTKFVFTIQASTHSYGHSRDNNIFSSQKYILMGDKIAQALQDFIKIMGVLPKRLEGKQKKKEKSSKSKLAPNTQIDDNKIDQNKVDQFFQGSQSDLQKQLILEIMNDQKHPVLQDHINQKSQSDSDCQHQHDDYSQSQLLKFQKDPSSLTQIRTERKIKKSKSKSKQKSLQHKLKGIKYNTIEQMKQANSSLILVRNKKPISPQRSLQKINQSYQVPKVSSRLQKPIQQNQSVVINIEKLDIWKSNQLQKYFNVQPNHLQRNKSSNHIYIDTPNQKELQPVHRKLPKIKSQLKKKQQPFLLIRKSFLPLAPKLTHNYRIFQSLDNPPSMSRQKSLIKQILDLHEKKRQKSNHNKKTKMKILFEQ